MSNFLNEYELKIGEKQDSPFMNKFDVYQDGTTPMYRDVDGKLWAMSGHSHMGHIGMFAGNTLEDMKELYPIQTNFCVGHADYAFSGIRYPEGVKPRGSIWPFGLYICPNTHRFFCFFHNETGWNAKGTGYDGYSGCETPRLDTDFRHVGLMHSDDEGKNWTFDRWVLTAENVCFTENYNPDGINVIGQKSGEIKLGSGDFSLYVEPDGDYMYIVYDIVRVDIVNNHWTGCDAYIARTRKRTDGVMGDFVKYYNGSFSEAGNLGKETPIIKNAWHPRMIYSQKHDVYLMTSCPVRTGLKIVSGVVIDLMEIRESKDMIQWSEPIQAQKNGEPFGNHYVAMVDDKAGAPNVFDGDKVTVLTNHNGTDVGMFQAEFIKK